MASQLAQLSIIPVGGTEKPARRGMETYSVVQCKYHSCSVRTRLYNVRIRFTVYLPYHYIYIACTCMLYIVTGCTNFIPISNPCLTSSTRSASHISSFALFEFFWISIGDSKRNSEEIEKTSSVVYLYQKLPEKSSS